MLAIKRWTVCLMGTAIPDKSDIIFLLIEPFHISVNTVAQPLAGVSKCIE